MFTLSSLRGAVVGLVVCLVCGAARGQPNLLTFEDIPGMGNSPGAAIPVVSQLRDQYLAQYGVRFFSGSPFVAVVIHGANTPSGTQIIGGSTAGGTLTYQQTNPVEAAFFDSTGTQARVVSDVSIRGDLQPIPGTKTLEAFNLAGTMIGAVTFQDSNPEPLRITMPGIHRVRMYSSSATVGFDDLRFDTPAAPPPTCPDVNGDGVVNTLDLTALLGHFGQNVPPGTLGDINGDGVVNTLDLIALLGVFGQVCP